MAHAVLLSLAPEDRWALESWVRAGTTEHRLVLRAKIVLAAAEGAANNVIAVQLAVSVLTVAKWRTRFHKDGISALQDAERSGKPHTYDKSTEKRVLAKLDEPPPRGYSTWNGPLLATALADVSVHQVWRILRQYGISLERRRS